MTARARSAWPDAGPGTRTLRPPRALGLVALALLLVLLAHAAWRDAQALAALLRGLAPAPLLGAAGLTLAASALVIALWRGLLARLGPRLPYAEAAAVLSLSYLARYLPGGVWGFAAVGYLGRRRGLPYRAGAFSLAATLALQAAAAGAWAAPALAGWGWPGLGQLWLPSMALAGGAAALLAPAPLRRLARPLGVAGPAAAVPGWAAALAVGWLGYWAISGAALALVLRALGVPPPPLPALIGIGAAAWRGGLLGAVAPAGLGVQDAALVLLLGRLVPPEAALGAALLARGLKTANDALYGLLGLLLHRRLGLGDGEETGDAIAEDRTVGGASPR